MIRGCRLRRGAAVVPIVLAALVSAACTTAPTGGRTPSPGVAATSRTAGPAPEVPEWDRPGDPTWSRIDVGRPHDVEGFAETDSARPGQPVRLYVSTVARSYRVRAFRMGWYGGARARLVWRSAWLPGRRQAGPRVTGATRTPSAPWRPSLTLDTTGWPPGAYLLRLDTDRGALGRFVPLTLRAPTVRGAVVLVDADTTWQAYNAWGGYSLYHGPDGARADRARAVSFDRPYDYGAGAADFIGAEVPLLALAERLRLRLAYVTDVDLHRDPTALDGAAAVVSLGHDEYWSPAMRAAVTRARDRGGNVAFLGANAVYRKIRFAPSPLGPDRVEVNYKDATDPIGRTDPAQVTTQWREPPSSDNGSSLTGTDYGCSPVRADMVVLDPGSWLLTGLGLRAGSRLRGLVGSEYDRVWPGAPTPRPIQVLTRTPLVCDGRADVAEMAYYTTRSGAGVLDTGTSDWIAGLDSADPPVRRVVTAVTTRLLLAFAAGPAGRTHPARDTARTR